MTFGGFVQTVKSNQTPDASIDSAFHQHKSWKLPDILFSRHIGDDSFHPDMAAREQYKWGILQIYKDDVGVCGFESLHGVGKHFLGIRRNAAPDRIVASKLPDHEIGL